MTDTTRSSHPCLSMTDNIAMSTGDFLLLCGRILLGWIFLRSGWGKIDNIAAYSAGFPARGLMPWMAWIAVPFEFLGGIALILGLATRYVVIGFIIFMLVATFSSHAYWNFTDVAQRRIQDFGLLEKPLHDRRPFAAVRNRAWEVEPRPLAREKVADACSDCALRL